MVLCRGNLTNRTHPGSPYPPTDKAYIRELEECIRDAAAPFGDIEVLDEKFRLYQIAANLLDKATPALRKQYPDQWVSMDEKGTLTVAHTVEELIDKMADQGVRSGDFPVAHLDTKPRRWVLVSTHGYSYPQLSI